MCRFTLYLGDPIRLASLVTEPRRSLIRQSFASEEREEPLNGDGFGIAWYAPEMDAVPGLFRSITPAWNNRNLLSLSKVVSSPCIMAHVRAATQGSGVDETNCHPFVRGRYAFMHNGDVGGFADVRRSFGTRLSDAAFSALEGTTDSEHLFALFLDRLEAHGADPGLDDMSAALTSSFRDAVALSREHGGGAPSYLNVAVTDGRRAVVSRVTTDRPEDAESLYVYAGARYLCTDGKPTLIAQPGHVGSVLVSSEPLTDDPGWKPLEPNSLLLIDAGRRVKSVPFTP
jgi:glutamine amidotransferase